jgi:alpha-tubulin suppressor-like RCC1 family protein
VSGLTDAVLELSAGGEHTCALRSGTVSCWGNNLFGRLGDGTTTNRLTPTPVMGL